PYDPSNYYASGYAAGAAAAAAAAQQPYYGGAYVDPYYAESAQHQQWYAQQQRWYGQGWGQWDQGQREEYATWARQQQQGGQQQQAGQAQHGQQAYGVNPMQYQDMDLTKTKLAACEVIQCVKDAIVESTVQKLINSFVKANDKKLKTKQAAKARLCATSTLMAGVEEGREETWGGMIQWMALWENLGAGSALQQRWRKIPSLAHILCFTWRGNPSVLQGLLLIPNLTLAMGDPLSSPSPPLPATSIDRAFTSPPANPYNPTTNGWGGNGGEVHRTASSDDLPPADSTLVGKGSPMNLTRDLFDDGDAPSGFGAAVAQATPTAAGLNAGGAAEGATESRLKQMMEPDLKVDDKLNPYAMLAKETRPCCNTDRILRNVDPSIFNPLRTTGTPEQQPKPAICIIDAMKITEGTSSFVCYVIRTDIPNSSLHLESRRRYSDFESFHRLLRKSHPTVVVPPVPEKHTVADYAAKPGKAKSDPNSLIVETRKRLLQSFLNRVMAHPVLSRLHFVHRFLDGNGPEGGAGWTEILMDSGLAHVMKKKGGPTSNAPLKISDSLLKTPDQHFLAAEDFTFRYSSTLSSIAKHHRRVSKLTGELSNVGCDLGSAYNAWSLMEQPSKISPAVEAIGAAVDETVTAQTQLARTLEDYVSGPLGEHEKLTKSIESILRWRHGKHVALEQVQESLVAKRVMLVKLESVEGQKRRLNAILGENGVAVDGAVAGAGMVSEPASYTPPVTTYATPNIARSGSSTYGGYGGGASAIAPAASVEDAATSASMSASMTGSVYGAPTTSSGRSSSGGGIFSAFGSLIGEGDPEAARRANMVKTRERIVSLESERRQATAELEAINEGIQADLDRFQKDKIRDFRNMLLAHAVAQRDACRKGLEAWEEARAVIERVRF
ncbi:Sorting nexin, cytoplasm-to-vacuole targeting pathway/endosomal sorting, partial [Irineochytrium annulatum]